jgi:hypothetical protein
VNSQAIIHRDLPIGDRPASGAGDFCHRLGEGQRAGTGDLQNPAAEAVFGQRRHRDRGDVVGIDEGFGHIAHRQGQFARGQGLGEQAFGKILLEPAGPHHRPVEARPRLADPGKCALRRLRPLFAAAREHHDPARARHPCRGGEGGDIVCRSRHRQIGCIGDIDRAHALQRRRPALPIGPVEAHRVGGGRHVARRPSARSPAATRRPVLPVPPATSTGRPSVVVDIVVMSVSSPKHESSSY